MCPPSLSALLSCSSGHEAGNDKGNFLLPSLLPPCGLPEGGRGFWQQEAGHRPYLLSHTGKFFNDLKGTQTIPNFAFVMITDDSRASLGV